ncbi:TPA: hypothetical protein ACGZ9Q_002366 [Elizabethkingia anophelis]|uniref:hypothetical protein n=1 Tax=Elizabethkingia anophelis TaxID=1117645 RepID=UPI00372F1AFD|nr:hypothetical protein [Elizabethkingia anophelis]
MENGKNESCQPKKVYLAPEFEVSWIEMEEGIAANSATVNPALTGGNTDLLQTDWNTTENNNVDVESPF